MDPQLVQFIPAAGALVFGMALGVGLAWLLLRNRAQAARGLAIGESQTEISLLSQRLSSVGEELGRERVKLGAAESYLAELQNQLNATRVECAQLKERADRVPELQDQLASLHPRLQEEASRSAALAAQSSRIPGLEESLASAALENQQLNEQVANLRVKVAELTTDLSKERGRAAENLALLDEAREKLSDAFKSLASDILEQTSSRFTEQNKTNIGQILGPLATKIQEFQAKVELVHHQDSTDRTTLREQVRQLMSLSERVSDDARNLADALKGSSKTQGNWGELILESVLEASGLRKGHEYELRETYHYEDGNRGQPDVVIRLPEERQLVIDAKVSLTDYDRYANAGNDAERQSALESHVASVRRHIKELSEKNYHTLYELNSLDLVVMFVPIEPAFAAAVAEDGTLWEEGLRRNVLLVSPSILLFVLRTVAYLWRQEAQARNVQEIAKCGADLYDKFVGFVADMKGLGHQLQKADSCYENAFSKLHEGKGNLVGRADKLRKLGVTPKKSLPPELVEAATEEPLIIDSISAVAEDAEPSGAQES
jgi:DNA recombination protein RmuC